MNLEEYKRLAGEDDKVDNKTVLWVAIALIVAVFFVILSPLFPLFFALLIYACCFSP